MNIAVYLGASKGKDKIYEEKVKELGTFIANNHHRLIYGGSKTGLMGIIADSVLENHGEVIGVEPMMFMDKEFQHENLTKLYITKTMSERKAKMISLSNAFIAFPGGTGTLEEISEIMSMLSLNMIHAPCIFYNFNHYYDDIKNFLCKMINEGFTIDNRIKDIYFASSLIEIEKILSQYN